MSHRKGKTKTGTNRVYLNHAEHKHPQTKNDRATCLRYFKKHGVPWDGVADTTADPVTRGQKAAATRARRKKQEEQAAGVDALLAATVRNEAEASTALDKGDGGTYSLPGEVTVGEPVAPSSIRDEYGRFTKATLKKWDTLLDHLEGAQNYIKHNGIELTSAALTTEVGGQVFTAIFDGDEWTLEARTDNELFE